MTGPIETMPQELITLFYWLVIGGIGFMAGMIAEHIINERRWKIWKEANDCSSDLSFWESGAEFSSEKSD